MVENTQPPAAWKHFVAGNVGGVVGLSLCYPLDTVKVRLQTRPAGTYRNMTHAFATMFKTEGLSSFYRGLLSPVLGYGAIKATAFGSYAAIKSALQKRSPDLTSSMTDQLLSGMCAGFVQAWVRAPVEQIKVVMQARNLNPNSTLPPYRGSIHCLVDVIKTEGVQQGLFRGMPATLLREIPQYGLYYPTYEYLKRSYSRYAAIKDSEIPKAVTAVLGGTAGVIQWVPTYGFDVVKSRVQAAPPGTYKGLADCARQLWKQEGFIQSFFGRGFGTCILRAFPLHGAIFLGYEMSMVYLARL